MKNADNELTASFKSQGIPLIDVDTPEQAAKAITEVMNGWDIIGKQKAIEELSKTHIIICKLVHDWVNPYAKEGREVPVVLFSTHPEWKTGTRFDNGLMECTFLKHLTNNNLAGYFVICFDSENRIRKYNPKCYMWE